MLKRFKRAFLLTASTSVIVMALVFLVVQAGSLTPPGAPGMTMHSLQEIYDVLADNNTVVSVADINGNVLEQLKYISSMTLQQIYNNSGATPTITDAKNGSASLTLNKTGTGNIFELQNAAMPVFTVDKLGNVSNVLKISSAATEDLTLEAATGVIQAATGSTFYNAGGYAIAAVGEEILRASIPIFGYSFPARTAGTKTISRELALDVDDTTVFPAVPITGVDRKYKFKIQYSNDAATAGNSVWQITLAGPPISDFGAPFNVPNTEIANLDESKVYYTAAFMALPDHVTDGKWYLVVAAPAGMAIQVYQIELMAYDVLQ